MDVNAPVLKLLGYARARAAQTDIKGVTVEMAELRMLLGHIEKQDEMIQELEYTSRKQQARIKFLEATDALR